MAFITPNSRQAQQDDDSWKSQAFINFWLPAVNGGRRKLGSIPLKESKPAEKQLIDYLRQHPDSLTEILNGMEVDFQLADDVENSGFLLPGTMMPGPKSQA